MYIHIYIYRYMRHTLVVRSLGYVMWEGVSISNFYNIVTFGNGR